MSFAISLCMLDTSHLLNSWFANIFSQFVVCLFILLTGLFQRKKFFILIKLNLSIFLLWAKPLLAKEPMNSLVNSRSQEFNPAFCLQSFRVLHFIFVCHPFGVNFWIECFRLRIFCLFSLFFFSVDI